MICQSVQRKLLPNIPRIRVILPYSNVTNEESEENVARRGENEADEDSGSNTAPGKGKGKGKGKSSNLRIKSSIEL